MAYDQPITCDDKSSSEDIIRNLFLKSGNGRALRFVNISPAFSPIDISGLKAWYNATLANVTKDGSDKISQVNDLSGNGFHLTQSTGANQPLWIDADLNGYPAIKFDGVNDYLINTLFSLSQPFTFFIVAKAVTKVAAQVFMCENAAPFCFTITSTLT